MISKFIRFSVIAIILTLPGRPALSQTDYFKDYHVEHFTDENGLPQNSINDLLFDKKGFLWLAVQVGLARFDGYSFSLYAPDDKPAMGSNIQSLGENEGDIYCQTTDRHLYGFSAGNKPCLEPLNAPDLKRPFLLNRKRLFNFDAFLRDAQPGESRGIRRLIFNDLFDHNRNFFAIDPSHLYLLYNDTLYYYAGSKLTKLSPAADHALKYLLIDETLYVLKDHTVLSVYRDGINAAGAGPIGGDLTTDTRGHLAGQDTFRLFTGDINHLLLNKRLYRIRPAAGGGLRGDYLLDIDFANNVSAIDFDVKLDLLVIATQTEGFYALRKSRFLTPGFSLPLQEQLSRYLFGPMALCDGKDILTDRFIFTSQGKFDLLQPNLPLWQKSLFVDHANRVWTSINRLPRMLTDDMKPARLFPALDGPIAGYAEDGKGDLYCLTDKSLWRRQADSFQHVFNNGEVSFNGPGECIGLVSPHLLWIGGSHGLIEYDSRSNKTTVVPELREAHVRCIQVCRDSSVLLGTYGQGYYYYRHGRFFHMPLDKNRFLVTTHCFLEDRKGAIWIACNKGLFKIPKADMDSWCDSAADQLYYYYYGRQDGLRTNEFNGGVNSSGLITPDGFVALLSMKGIVCFHTDSLRSDFPAGPIGITNIEIDGKNYLKKDSIELPAGYNSLFLDISCPYLGDRSNLYLEYFVKGLAGGWKEVPRDGNINLSRLGTGNYALLVRKVNGFGKNNFSYREWNISVIPHFYQTGWFFLLAVLALFLLVFLLVQSRFKLNQKQKEIHIKADKLKDTVVALEDTVEKLQGSQKALLQTSKMKEKLISLVIHDLRSPIRFLSMLAADLNDNLAGFSRDELKERTYGIKKGAGELYTFSEDFLLWVTAQRNNFSITERSFLIRPLLQEIDDFFRDQVQQKGNSLCIDAPEELKMFSDPHILITIIRNLVDNANKYTDQGKIAIRAYEEGAYFFISVTDTGKGMNPQQIDAFLQNESLDDIRSGSQLGHKFIFDLTKRIGGMVSLDSREREGTTVVLRFNKG
jgi:signal transduction histidine kinase